MTDSQKQSLTKEQIFLSAAASLYAEQCPPLSRHLISSLPNLPGSEAKYVCSHCHGLFVHDTLHTDVKRKARLGKNIRRLQSKHWRMLSIKERKVLLKWQKNRANHVLYRCKVCKQTTKVKGAHSSFLIKTGKMSSAKSTPGGTPVCSSPSHWNTSPSAQRFASPLMSVEISPSVAAKNIIQKNKNYKQLQIMLKNAKKEKKKLSASPLHKFLKSL